MVQEGHAQKLQAYCMQEDATVSSLGKIVLIRSSIYNRRLRSIGMPMRRTQSGAPRMVGIRGLLRGSHVVLFSHGTQLVYDF